MTTRVSFVLDGELKSLEFGPGSPLRPTTTVLQYLRGLTGHRGVKEGCAEGDCGACTVVLGEPAADGKLAWRPVDSCLLFLPMLHRRLLVTVENLRAPGGDLHPVQQSMVDLHGSQCGFCTPGIVMTLFALHQERPFTRATATQALSGNLCRCTGYRSILDAALEAAHRPAPEHVQGMERTAAALLRDVPDATLVLEGAGQRYWRPATLADAIELRRAHPGARIVGGATDVALQVTKGFEVFPEVLDLSGVNELRHWSETPDALVIGAGLPLEWVMERAATAHPALAEMLRWFGSRQIRNLATLGGNLGTASPIGDTLPVLVAAGARVRVAGAGGARELPVEQFLQGYRRTALAADELITAVVLPRPAADETLRAYKVSKRREMDIATVSAAFRLVRDGDVVREAVLAYGGMADTVKRAARAEAFLHGKPWTRDTVEQAMARIEQDFTPLSDARGGADMRRIAARNLLLKFWSDTAGEGARAVAGAAR